MEDCTRNFVRFFQENPPTFAKDHHSKSMIVGGKRYAYDTLESVQKLFTADRILNYDLGAWYKMDAVPKMDFFVAFVEENYRKEVVEKRKAQADLKKKLSSNGKADLKLPDVDFIMSHLQPFRVLGDKRKEGGVQFLDTTEKKITDYDFYSVDAALRAAEVDKDVVARYLTGILHVRETYDPHNPYSFRPTEDEANVYEVNRYVTPEWRKEEKKGKLPKEIDQLMRHLFPSDTCREFVYTWIYHSLTSRCGTYLYLCGGQGCLAGDTFIPYAPVNGAGRVQNWKGGTIRQLFERFNKTAKRRHKATTDSKFVVSSMDDDGFIFKNDIEGVVYSGVKECFKLTTERGLEITATADHKFFVGDRYLPLGDLRVGDGVMVHDNVRYTGDDTGRQPRNRYAEIMVKYHPAKRFKEVTVPGGTYTYCRVRKSRALIEAKINGMSFEDYVDALNTWEPERLDRLKWLPREVNVHHINEDHRDDRLENLMLVPHAEHAREHAKSHSRLKFVVVEDRVAKIERIGEIDTYDIQCKFPFNNFVANKFVVHNSGKNTLAALIAALHGASNVSNPKQDSLTARFNHYLKFKRFIFFDEFNCRVRRDKDILKLIINDRVQIEGKGRDHEDIDIHASYFLANNSLEAIGLDPVDRRFSVPNVNHDSLVPVFGRPWIESLHERIKSDPELVADFGWWVLRTFDQPKWGKEEPYQPERFEEIVLATARLGIAEMIPRILRREQNSYDYYEERASFTRVHKGQHYPPIQDWTKFFQTVKVGGEALGRVEGKLFIPRDDLIVPGKEVIS